MKEEPLFEKATRKQRKDIYFAVGVIIILVLGWMMVQPGVFVIQPIGAIPDGVTLVYYSRNPEMAFFSSPDGLCLKMQNSVSILCRMAALSAASGLTDRVIMRLPYSEWAYLQSTGGRMFDR